MFRSIKILHDQHVRHKRNSNLNNASQISYGQSIRLFYFAQNPGKIALLYDNSVRHKLVMQVTYENVQGCGIGLDVSVSRRTHVSSQSHLGLGRLTSRSRPFTSRAQDQF